MKKTYASPELTVHGDIEKITNALGGTGVEDTVFDQNGNPTDVFGRTEGSIDLCATQNDVNCL